MGQVSGEASRAPAREMPFPVATDAKLPQHTREP